MPKIKTHKGARRRFRVTGTGMIMRRKIGGSHLRRKKTGRVKRQYGKMMPLDPSNISRVKVLFPYR